MRKRLHLAIILFVSSFSAVHAQTTFSDSVWHFIDTSIINNRNLTELYRLVDGLKLKATEEKKYFHIARCLYYQQIITDARTEDSLYFKNSAFIDEMLLQKQPLELVFSLHLLQARRLTIFGQKYLRYRRVTYARKDIPVNYAAFEKKELDSIAAIHFEKAKEISAQLASANASEALWLSIDPLLFLFKPGLYDIAIAEQISIADKNIYYYDKREQDMFYAWLGLPINDLYAKLESLSHSKTGLSLRLKYYGEWMNYKKNEPNSIWFIETLARKYIYEKVKPNNNNADSVYEKYLVQIANSPYPTVKAHGVYQLALLWNSQSSKYFPSDEIYSEAAGNYSSRLDFNYLYRYHADKALNLFNRNKNLLDSFGYLKRILLVMEDKIKRSQVLLSIPEKNLPGKSILGELKFKNTDTLYYKVIRLNQSDDFTPYVDGWEKLLYFLNKSPVYQSAIDLPTPNDHNFHNIYLNVGQFPVGRYVLLFSGNQTMDTNFLPKYVHFDVTNISVVNNDKRIYVLNRQTGRPLTGAKVKATYHAEKGKDESPRYKSFEKNYLVNSNGYFETDNSKYDHLTIIYNNDTIDQSVAIMEYEKPDEVYSKDEYEDLVEYYEDNATAYIYTDRSIYRPGQIVFYKAIFITRNKDTGEPIVMSKRNLKGKLFENVYKKWQKESEPWLLVTDPFGRDMDSIKIELSDFGSISGSFKIPKTAATGEWEIAPDYIDVEYAAGTFKVEEYKRPSYELSIEKPKKELLPGDEFTFKVNVRSFAGASLNNVHINYKVVKNSPTSLYDRVVVRNTYQLGYKLDTLLNAVGYTDNEGTLEIKVKDSAAKGVTTDKDVNLNFTYTIYAEAVETTGESYEEQKSISVSNRPITIKIPLQTKYDRVDLVPLSVETEDENYGDVKRNVRVKIYRLIKETRIINDRKLFATDLWLYDSSALQKQFPYDNILRQASSETKKLVFERNIETGGSEKLILDEKTFPAGNYEITAECIFNDTLRGNFDRRFSVFDTKENKLAEPSWGFDHLQFNSAKPADTIKYVYGNTEDSIYTIFHIVHYIGQKKADIKYLYQEKEVAKGIHEYALKIPATAIEMLEITKVHVYMNQVFTKKHTIYISNPGTAEPGIVIEKYRKRLTPGSKETFSISIKTKNENIAAELMTTMYDASLDRLEKHKWEKPRGEKNFSSFYLDWTDKINSVSKNAEEFYNEESFFIQPGHMSSLKPLWWKEQVGYTSLADEDVMADFSLIPQRRNYQRGGFYTTGSPVLRSTGITYDPYNTDMGLQGRVAGVSLSYTTGLDEVVVVGYGTGRKKNLTGAAVRIRGANSVSLKDVVQPLIILDGQVFTGDLSKLDPNTITAGLILNGADATAIYGSQASNGVLVLSTKGEIVFPDEPEQVLIPRKNFNETAFFFPAIHMGKDGYYIFSFTMPESVTEWNWKMLAHTRSSVFVYAERKLNTQLPLMVQPNMPRLLYQGDKIVLQSRITNLDSSDASGKVICKIEDAVTGNDITNTILSNAQRNFSVVKRSNIAESFELKIPQEQLNAIKIIISVKSENFVDGEEHILPILSPAIFVRESLPFHFVNKSDSVVQLPAIPQGARFYGAGLSIQSKPQAALINSLPYLANYPLGCAEQNFNRLLAHLIALDLMRDDPMARASFETASKFVEENTNNIDDKLPDVPVEETMPWLSLTNKVSQQQKQLFNLFDTSKTINVSNEMLAKIYKCQSASGGLTWFPGGTGDFYISNYVLRGFGKLENDGLPLPQSVFDHEYASFIKKLVNYVDAEFENRQLVNKKLNYLFYLYARSYWLKAYSFNPASLDTVKKFLVAQWLNADKKSLHEQSLLIITSLRFSKDNQDELYKKAMAQLESVRQLAIEDGQNGLRWKKMADEDDLTNSSEETIALLAEAFKEAGRENDVRDGIIKWLMTTKKDHHWTSTKATAAVIGLLNQKDKNVTGVTQAVSAKIIDQTITVTNDLLSGNGFSFAQTTQWPGSISLQKQATVSANGNVSWYYFTSASELSRLNKEILLDKKYFKWNEKENKWEILADNTKLKIADKIKVICSIQTSKNLQYVFIDDKRAAGFEPIDKSSGYEYEQGQTYYKSIRDAGFQFFSDFIPAGKHEISYELKVAHEGSFNCSPAVLQCMYKPELVAYGNGAKFIFEK